MDTLGISYVELNPVILHFHCHVKILDACVHSKSPVDRNDRVATPSLLFLSMYVIALFAARIMRGNQRLV